MPCAHHANSSWYEKKGHDFNKKVTCFFDVANAQDVELEAEKHNKKPIYATWDWEADYAIERFADKRDKQNECKLLEVFHSILSQLVVPIIAQKKSTTTIRGFSGGERDN